MAKVETTLTLEQLDAALELNGSLRVFDAGYAKGFAAGLEAGAEMADREIAALKLIGHDAQGDFKYEIGILNTFATALRERAREEKSSKTIEREGKGSE